MTSAWSTESCIQSVASFVINYIALSMTGQGAYTIYNYSCGRRDYRPKSNTLNSSDCRRHIQVFIPILPTIRPCKHFIIVWPGQLSMQSASNLPLSNNICGRRTHTLGPKRFSVLHKTVDIQSLTYISPRLRQMTCSGM